MGAEVDFLAAFFTGGFFALTAVFLVAFFTGAFSVLTAVFLVTCFAGVVLLLTAFFLAAFFLMSGVMICSCRLKMDATSREYYIYTVQRSSLKAAGCRALCKPDTNQAANGIKWQP